MKKIVRKKYRTNAFSELERLRNLYRDNPEDLKLLDEKEQQLRTALEVAEVGSIPAIINLTNDAIDEIGRINATLCKKKDLSDLDRQCLFYTRDVYEFFLDRLNGGQARSIISSIEGWASKHIDEHK